MAFIPLALKAKRDLDFPDAIFQVNKLLPLSFWLGWCDCGCMKYDMIQNVMILHHYDSMC